MLLKMFEAMPVAVGPFICHNNTAVILIIEKIFAEQTLKLKHMSTKIFVNLAVKDLAKSKTFFSQLGYQFNPQFTDENAACMIISEHIYAMLLTEPFFKNFTKKKIADAKTTTEALICLSANSRQEVDEMVAKAVAAGATTPNEKQDHGFMYGHGFEDLDGHLWEIMFMEPGAVQPVPQETETLSAN